MKLTSKDYQGSTGRPMLSEHDIQGLIINYLESKGFYVQRINSGKFQVGHGKKTRWIQGAKKGTPDVLAFRRFNKKIKGIPLDLPLPELYFFEIKRPGEEPELAQVLKMNQLEEFGAQCHVIHSLGELQELGI